MAFDYEAAKAQYGAARARQMEQEANAPPPPPPPSTPPPPGPPAPTSGAPPPPPNVSNGPYRPPTGQPTALPPPPPPPPQPTAQPTAQPQGLTIQQLQTANAGKSEDFQRFQQDDITRWAPFYDAASGKFKSSRGAPGLFDKPTECPPGQGPSGPNETDPCTTKGYSDGAGGAGGQGGRGGSGGAGSTGGAGGGGLDAMTEYWRKLAEQSGSRYTPEAMAAMEANQFSRARAQEKLQLDAAKQDMAQRGTSRSVNQNAAVRQIGVGTGQQIMANNADLAKRKIEADYQDKQAAIKNAQDWVNSMRDYMLRTDMNAIQREQIAAQIRLAQMNITQQTAMMEQSYQNDLGRMVAGGVGSY